MVPDGLSTRWQARSHSHVPVVVRREPGRRVPLALVHGDALARGAGGAAVREEVRRIGEDQIDRLRRAADRAAPGSRRRAGGSRPCAQCTGMRASTNVNRSSLRAGDERCGRAMIRSSVADRAASNFLTAERLRFEGADARADEPDGADDDDDADARSRSGGTRAAGCPSSRRARAPSIGEAEAPRQRAEERVEVEARPGSCARCRPAAR